MHIRPSNNAGSLLKPPVSTRLKSGCVVLRPGENVGEHVTDGREELLVVLSGTATIQCDGETAQAGEGSAVYIPEGKRHNVLNRSTAILKYVYTVVSLHT